MDYKQILTDDKDLQVLLVGDPKMCPTNPRWQTATMLKNLKNCHMSATVWLILIKFSTMMHMSPAHLLSC